jgi:hypothetical protein
VLGALLLAASGCGKRLRGLETADQILLDDGRSVLQQADGIEAVVTPVRVPWGSRDSPVGFAVELTNQTEGPVSLAVADIELHDAAGRVFEPIDPGRLRESFGFGSGERRAVQTVGHRAWYIRRHYYRRPYRYYRRYRWYPGYPWFSRTTGWYAGGIYFGDGPDPFAEQRRTARFLSELLTDQTIEPQHAVFGYVVFAYHLTDEERLTLVISVLPEPKPPTSAPAEGAAEAGPEPGEATTLSFRFLVD